MSSDRPVILESQDLRKEFDGGDNILSGADLAVRENEIVLLMGPNGVGKTVLLSCLAGSEVPTDGTVSVFGEATRGGNSSLDFMLQDSMLEPKLTGRENVAFYRDLHPCFTERWREYTEKLEVAEELDKLVENYSEGMKRKLEFALTMSGEVPIYLLDEPTAGVDLHNIQQFHDVILSQYERGKTFVISSHRPMDANIADRIAFMPDGTISSIGRPEELMAQVPTVVTVSGRETIKSVKEFVIEGELFPVGGEVRGFLEGNHHLSAIADKIEGTAGTVEEIEPTYTDLFNYYIHLEEFR